VGGFSLKNRQNTILGAVDRYFFKKKGIKGFYGFLGFNSSKISFKIFDIY
jgi:hypothetical protein